MKRVHPNLNLAALTIALAFLVSAVGCKNQQSAVAVNPFFGPNRVPPPATRALLPGQAQPYYQGDPLPVSQNGAGQPGGAATLAAAEPEMPSADGKLAWASPSGVMPTSNTQPAPTNAPPASRPPSSSVVASNEPTVAVPDDGNSMRFALPASAPKEPQPFTPNNPAALASAQTLASAPPTAQLPAPPSPRDVMQAAYTEPVITSSEAPAPSPWRSPQIAQANALPPTGVAPAYYYVPQPIAAQPIGQPVAFNAPASLPMYSVPMVAPTNTMDVRLREVPSPPMPRIRIPGYETSVPTIGSADGFRARTITR